MNDLSFKANSLFEEVRYDPNSKYWMFRFSDSIYVLVSTFWRVLTDRKITLVSLDHGNQFGMPKPVDVIEELSACLQGNALINLNVAKDTGDLKLSLTNNIELQIFVTSTGYESYQFEVEGKRYIALGGGEIAIMDK